MCFFAGVNRAIEIVDCALGIFEAPIYVRHEVVGNLRQRGAVFVNELHAVLDDNILIFSAQCVSQAVWQKAESRGS